MSQALGPGPEFDRIRRIISRLGPVAASLGDDCAVVPEGAGHLVVSTDMAVEGVHFRPEWLSLEEIGWRAGAAALSDIAAEGASVVGVLASVAVPAGADEDAPAAVMAGVGAAVHEAGGLVLGGDLTRADKWVIDVTALGRTARPVTRAGARPDDELWITGTLGGPRAALDAWLRGAVPDGAARTAFARPVPRVTAGMALARAGATAMLDLSDGLGGDARHLAAASGVALAIQLDALPVHPSVGPAARRAGMVPSLFAGLGGEDYELLAAMPPAFGEEEAAAISDATWVPLTRVGRVLRGTGARFLLGERAVPLEGFDHFR